MFDDEQEIQKNSRLQSIIFEEEKKKSARSRESGLWGLDVMKGQMLKRRLGGFKGRLQGSPKAACASWNCIEESRWCGGARYCKARNLFVLPSGKATSSGYRRVSGCHCTEHRRGLGASTPQNGQLKTALLFLFSSNRNRLLVPTITVATAICTRQCLPLAAISE